MIKRFLSKERLDLLIYGGLLLLALSECVSEPLSRHSGIFVIVVGLLRLVLYPKAVKNLFSCRTVLLLILVYLVGVLVGVAHSGHAWLTLTEDYSVRFNYSALLVLVIPALIKAENKLVNIMLLSGVSMLILDGHIFWQVFEGNMRPAPLSSRWLVALAVFYGMLTPMFFVFALKCRGRLKYAFGFLFVMGFLGTVATGIRSAWLSVIVVLLGLTFYEWRGNLKRAFGIAGVMIFAISIIAFANARYLDRMASVADMKQQQVTERFLMWESTMKMFRDNPLLGVGAGNWGDMYQQKYISPDAKEPFIRHAHSNYFQFLGEYGLLGLGAYLVMMIGLLIFFFKRRKETFALAMLAAQISFMLYSATESPYLEYGAMRLYWLLLGVSVAGTIAAKRELLK